jgi:hypothetical protein
MYEEKKMEKRRSSEKGEKGKKGLILEKWGAERRGKRAEKCRKENARKKKSNFFITGNQTLR